MDKLDAPGIVDMYVAATTYMKTLKALRGQFIEAHDKMRGSNMLYVSLTTIDAMFYVLCSVSFLILWTKVTGVSCFEIPNDNAI